VNNMYNVQRTLNKNNKRKSDGIFVFIFEFEKHSIDFNEII